MFKRKLVISILTAAVLLLSVGCQSDKDDAKPAASSIISASSAASTSSTSSTSSASSASDSKSSGKDAYSIKCNYIQNPDLIIPIADKSAAFWEKAYDEKNGGFFTYINRDGSIDTTKSYKVAFIQSRDVYGMTRAYQLTGKKEYLEYAQKGLDFLYKNGWDNKNGGWYQEFNADGTVSAGAQEGVDWNNTKCFFNQFYVLAGISAMYQATMDTTDGGWIDKAYDILSEKLWDSRDGYQCYFDIADRDWKNRSTKSVASNMDAITTHAETLCLLSPDKYKDRMLAIANNFVFMAKSLKADKLGYTVTYDADWNARPMQTVINSGTFLKPAWCLARAYLVDPKPEYKETSQKLINQLLNSDGYDKVNGGPFTSLNTKTGKSTNNRKVWWELEQGVTAGLTNYYISGNQDYLKMADESMNFFMNNMYDTQYGDVYNDTDQTGKDVNTQKGNYWKGGYHSIELFYYTYLYGNLMLHNKPVSLYYYIDADKKAREIPLKPLSLGENKLVITGITLNGKPYDGFDGSNCMLKLPADIGGEFKVTFSSEKFKN